MVYRGSCDPSGGVFSRVGLWFRQVFGSAGPMWGGMGRGHHAEPVVVEPLEPRILLTGALEPINAGPQSVPGVVIEVDAAPSFHFDFGKASSPVADGYRRVGADPYSGEAGYGWVHGKVVDGQLQLGLHDRRGVTRRASLNALVIEPASAAELAAHVPTAVFTGHTPPIRKSSAVLTLPEDVGSAQDFRWQSFDPVVGHVDTGHVTAIQWVARGSDLPRLSFFGSGDGATITGIEQDTGRSDRDGITKDNDLDVLGTADPGAVVELLLDGDSQGSTSADPITGDWTFNLAPQADGTYRLTALQTNPATNISTLSAPFDVTIDTTIAAPLITGIDQDTGASSTDGITMDQTLLLSGTADPDTTLTLSEAALGVLGTTTSSASGQWTFDFTATTLPRGDYQFTAVAEDIAGNVSARGPPFDVTVDTAIAAPVILGIEQDTGSSGSDGITADPTIVVTGTADAASTVTLTESLAGLGVLGTAVADSLGGWRFDFTGTTLADGNYRFSAAAEDLAGNISVPSAPFDVAIDSVAPPLILALDPASDTPPAGDGLTTDPSVHLIGTTEPDTQVLLSRDIDPTVPIATTTSDATGQYGFVDISLSLGGNGFVAMATDTAGNTATTNLTVTRSSGAPVIDARLVNDTAPGNPPPPPPCTFDNALTGWRSGESGGSNAGSGGVVASNCHAVLREGDSFVVSLERSFTVPDQPTVLTFSYTSLSFDTTDNSVSDAFEAALVDADGNPLVHTIDRDRDAFFNSSEGIAAAVGQGTTHDGPLISVDISRLFAGTTARFILRLVNNDQDVQTSVRITQFGVSSATDAPSFHSSGTDAPVSTVQAGPLTDDGLTFDVAVAGMISADNPIASLRAGFDGAPVASFVDVLAFAALQPDGAFTLDLSALQRVFGGPLTDAAHVLHLIAEDDQGNVSDAFDLNFTLDSRLPHAAIDRTSSGDVQFVDVVYDEPMAAAAFDVSAYRVQLSGGTDDGQSVSIATVDQLDEAGARVHFDQPLRSRNHVLVIDPGVTDPAGNPVASPRAFQFAVAGPLISVREFSPFDGEQMVSPDREVIVRFDGPVDPSTIDTDSLYLIANGERVAGTVRVSSTRRFATIFPDDPLPASTQVRMVVDGDLIQDAIGNPLDGEADGALGGIATADFQTLPLTRIDGTNVFGFVRDSFSGDPIVGATIRVDAFPAANVVTDGADFFELLDMPAPTFFVHIDGSTATNAPPGTSYPSVGKPLHSVPGQRTQLEMDGQTFDIFLPAMADGDLQTLSPANDTDVGFGGAGKTQLEALFPAALDPAVWDRLSVTFPAGSAQDNAGNPATQAVIIPVPPDRIPAPLPSSLQPDLVISIQAMDAAGNEVTNFDVPAPITFPNTEGLAPGETSLIFSFNHDAGRWDAIGTGTVSADGSTIVSDPGVGVRAPGWHAQQTGVIGRGGLVLANLGGLFGRTGGDELRFQTGRHFWAIEDLDNGFVIRGVSNVADTLIDQAILAANTNYRLSVLQLFSLKSGAADFLTGSGGFFTLPTVILQKDAGPDTDGEGLKDKGEFIVGTAVNNRDTDVDGVTDLAELRQRLDPLGGRAFPTGVIANLPLQG